MADLVVSYVAHSRTGTPYGHRILSDGTAEGYQVSKPVRQADGSFEYEAVEPGFYPIAKLSDQQVETVKRAIDEARLSNLPTTTHTQGSGNSEADFIEWQVGSDARTVRIAPWPPANEDPTAKLTALVIRLGEIILAAQANANKTR